MYASVRVYESVTDPGEAGIEGFVAYYWVKENLAELLPNPPQITAGEVVATRSG